MNKPKVLVIIPAYNEATNIGSVLKDLKLNISYADVLIVNDCSTDNTMEIITKAGYDCITNLFKHGPSKQA